MAIYDLGNNDDGEFTVVINGKNILCDVAEWACYLEPFSGNGGTGILPAIISRFSDLHQVTISWEVARRFSDAVNEMLDSLKKSTQSTPDSLSTTEVSTPVLSDAQSDSPTP